jgi:propanol-preferring alcohol dehydrogenase
MKVQRIHAWGGPLSLDDVARPVAGPGEILPKVQACGVGLTVLNCMRGDLGQRPQDLPRIPGHEIVGEVVACGAGVDGWSPRDRAMVYFYLSCGDCTFCRQGRESLCERFEGFVGVQRDGGYAEYVTVPARNAILLPQGIGWAEATAIPDAIGTPYHICRQRALVRPGRTVMVTGAGGGVGIHMVQMARKFGARVVGVDVGPEKLEAIRTQGAQAFDARDPDLLPALRHWADDRGVDVAVDFVGQEDTLALGLQTIGRGGTLVTVTTFPGVSFPVTPRHLVLNEVSIVGSRYVGRQELEEAARLVAAGEIHPVVSALRPLERVEEIHELLTAGGLIGRGATIPG